MFNRKLFFILLVVLLFILQISIVCAVDSNQTHSIETKDNYKLSVNNTKHECISKNDDFKNDSLDFNQGDKIPITIDSSEYGNLTVLVDGEVYYYESWLDSETIHIPTYNPSSFYNSSIKNIGVGTHKISLVFSLNTFKNYVPVVSKDDSNLKFKFQTYEEVLDTKYTYTHNLTLNIHEKRKTINVSFYEKPVYHDFIYVSIGFDNDTLMDMLKVDTYLHHFGIILSNNEKILYKDVYNIFMEFDKYELDIYMPRASFVVPCQCKGITFFVESVLGICNLTVVNFADGTTDTVLFNVSKFITGIPEIECVINGFNATFHGFHDFIEIFFNIGNEHKFISESDRDYNWDVTFVNLSPGVHVLRLYYPETDFIKQFSYNWTFEIPGSSNVPENINISGNHSFNMFPNMLLTNGGAFLFFSQNDGMQNIEDFTIIDDSGVKNSESKLGSGSNSIGESNSIGIDGGNSGSGEYSSSSNKKSYEIQEKSTSKVIDNSLIKLGLIIILTISFMMGFVRFKKRLIQ